jgi:hypothetical protein
MGNDAVLFFLIFHGATQFIRMNTSAGWVQLKRRFRPVASRRMVMKSIGMIVPRTSMKAH